MAKIDYKDLSEKIMANIGGEKNVKSVTHCVRYISLWSGVKQHAPSSNSVFRPDSIVSGRCHLPVSSFCEKNMSPFFVPVMPLNSSPWASLRVEVKYSWSYSSPKSIGEYSALRELNMSIFLTIYCEPASFSACAVCAASRPVLASSSLGSESRTS